ncbi:hypothetical protein KW807_02250 [Candidatus Parcubacteria bacterium]|nr:hypothetical protein [Candidatus Parcubacteria bacterium]
MKPEEAKLANKLWRLNNLYFIKTKGQKLVPMKLKPAQQDFFTRRALRSYILKARQIGFSTACLIDLLDETIFTPNTNSAILAHHGKKVTILFEIVKRAFENLPASLKPRVSFENRNELYFPDLDSKIYVTLDTRSETVHNLHISELAFVERAEAMLAGTLESVPKGGRITFETTANGMGNYAYDTWVDAESEFQKLFYPWWWEDEYQEETTKTLAELEAEYAPLAIRYGTIRDVQSRFNLSLEKFAFYIGKVRRHKELVKQEYPCTDIEAFIASGRGVFNSQDLAKHPTMNPIDRKWGDLMIYEYPLVGFRYVMGVDTSEGGGGDNAVIQVLNAHTGEQAAEYAMPNIKPDELGGLAIAIAKYYNNAFIVPEINSSGISFVDHIKTKYMNIYHREVIDKRTRQTSEAIGWRTTGVTKPRLVNALEEAVREEYIRVNSAECLKEMHTFVRSEESGSQGFGAEGNNKDDRVMALGLAYQGLKFMPKMKKPESVAQAKLRQYIERNKMIQELGVEQANTVIKSKNRQARYKIRQNASYPQG